jgi:hypothetical protein
VVCAKANGLPSESRQIAHTSPGCTTAPPLALTRSSVATRSSTAKYGSENESPGPRPRTCTPTAGAPVCVCQPSPSPSRRGSSSRPNTPDQKRRARSGSSAGNSIKEARASGKTARNPTLPWRRTEAARTADRGRGPRLAAPAPSSSRPTAISAAAGTAATPDRRSGPIQSAVARLSAESHGTQTDGLAAAVHPCGATRSRSRAGGACIGAARERLSASARGPADFVWLRMYGSGRDSGWGFQLPGPSPRARRRRERGLG